MKLTINKAWFVHWHHDLYGGLFIYGPFSSEEDAKKFVPTLEVGDSVNVYYLPFVEFEDHIYVLHKNITACEAVS